MNIPKPPFHSATEELLYNIYLKLPDARYLTADDINTLAKLNVILSDADLLKAEDINNAVNALKGNVPVVANSLEKLYNIIQGLNYLRREDIDTLAEINSLLLDADLVKKEELSDAISSIDTRKEFQFYFHSRGGDNDYDDWKDTDRFVIRGKITSISEDWTNELSSVSYKSRLDTSSNWIAHRNLAALQSWINPTITGDHLTGSKYWLKCIPVYKTGKCGEAVNLFGYNLI